MLHPSTAWFFLQPLLERKPHTLVVSVVFREADVVESPPLVEMAVDKNRDGLIKFITEDASDTTSSSSAYRFWLNDDQDVSTKSVVWSDPDPETYVITKPDNSDTVIQSTRDLEDFARLQLWIQDRQEQFKSGEYQVGLKWRNSIGSPKIRVFAAYEEDGGWNYIKDPQIAIKQTLAPYNVAWADIHGYTVVTPNTNPDADYVFTKAVFAAVGEDKPKVFFLFEGVEEGSGELVPILLDKYGQKITEGQSIWISLRNIEHLYERAHATPPITNFPLPYGPTSTSFPYSTNADGAVIIPPENLGYDVGFDAQESGLAYEATPDEEKKCIVFVHGIDMPIPDLKSYMGSAYKRLWWEGFRGKMAAFRWSTPFSGTFSPFDSQPFDPLIFSFGEYTSWSSGLGLKGFVNSLYTTEGMTTVSIAGHSLGNACVGSALRQGMVVDNYVMMEAAVSLSCYSPPPTGTDPLASSFLQRLVDADIASPTPNEYMDLGYRGFLQDIHTNVRRRWVNYHNLQDFWLATGKALGGLKSVDWITWQSGSKPEDPIGDGTYTYKPENARAHRCFWQNLAVSPRPVEDPHESMAFIARSRTGAVGSEPSVGNPQPPFAFGHLDLNSDYNFGTARPDHSGQFQRNIQMMYSSPAGVHYQVPLYRRLMDDLGAPPTAPPQ